MPKVLREGIPRVLNALGKLELGLINSTLSFLTLANQILVGSESKVVQQEAIRSQSDPATVIGEIENLISSISNVQKSKLESEQ